MTTTRLYYALSITRKVSLVSSKTRRSDIDPLKIAHRKNKNYWNCWQCNFRSRKVRHPHSTTLRTASSSSEAPCNNAFFSWCCVATFLSRRAASPKDMCSFWSRSAVTSSSSRTSRGPRGMCFALGIATTTKWKKKTRVFTGQFQKGLNLGKCTTRTRNINTWAHLLKSYTWVLPWHKIEADHDSTIFAISRFMYVQKHFWRIIRCRVKQPSSTR